MYDKVYVKDSQFYLGGGDSGYPVKTTVTLHVTDKFDHIKTYQVHLTTDKN